MSSFDGKHTLRCIKGGLQDDDDIEMPAELQKELQNQDAVRQALSPVFDGLKAEGVELKDAIRLVAASGIEAMTYHLPPEACIAWLENWVKTIKGYTAPTDQERAEFRQKWEQEEVELFELRQKFEKSTDD